MSDRQPGERYLYDWQTSIAVAVGGTVAAVILIVIFTYLVDWVGSFWSQVVYFTGQSGIGVSPADGTLLWRFNWKTMFDINAATPIFADGCVFVSSNYGKGGALLRLRPSGDPEVVWKNLAMANHFSTCVLYQGHLYGFSDARFRCVEFSTGKEKWDRAGLGRGSLQNRIVPEMLAGVSQLLTVGI